HPVICSSLLYLLLPLPPRSTLFPYTTLFRSQHDEPERRAADDRLPRLALPVERSRKAVETRDDRGRDREQQDVEGDPVGARAVRSCGCQHRRERCEATQHRAGSSPPRRTLLRVSLPARITERSFMAGSLTWLGHASFRLDTPGGKRVYLDPWLSGPTCPDSEREPERIDAIAVTHG